MNKLNSFTFSLITIMLMGVVGLTQAQEAEQTEQVPADRSVQILSRIPPLYPTLALAKKTEGWVKVAFTINRDGDVEDISVVESEPPQVFDQAAVEAVRQFKFLPSIKNGELVPQRAAQVIEFEIPDQGISNMAFFGGFLHNLNKAQGIARQSLQGQNDVLLLVKDVRLKSNIKIDQQTLNQLVLEVIPDETGYPESIEVLRNDFGDKGIELNVPKKKQRILEGAKIAAKAPAGYYNPTYVYAMAKNHPPTVFGIMEAQSMPTPDYSHEMTLTAQLTIDEQGRITEVKEANIDGEPVTTEFMALILETLLFEPAFQDFKPVKDTVDFTLVASLVQKSDIEALKKERMAQP